MSQMSSIPTVGKKLTSGPVVFYDATTGFYLTDADAKLMANQIRQVIGLVKTGMTDDVTHDALKTVLTEIDSASLALGVWATRLEGPEKPAASRQDGIIWEEILDQKWHVSVVRDRDSAYAATLNVRSLGDVGPAVSMSRYVGYSNPSGETPSEWQITDWQKIAMEWVDVVDRKTTE